MPNQSKKKLAERIRLNLEFPPQIYEQMQAVQQRSNASSLTEVLRRSLALYDIITEHIVGGGEIELVGSDGTKEKLRIL